MKVVKPYSTVLDRHTELRNRIARHQATIPISNEALSTFARESYYIRLLRLRGKKLRPFGIQDRLYIHYFLELAEHYLLWMLMRIIATKKRASITRGRGRSGDRSTSESRSPPRRPAACPGPSQESSPLPTGNILTLQELHSITMSTFKYLSPDRTDLLKNHEIRFTQVKYLNDPFEFLPVISRIMDRGRC